MTSKDSLIIKFYPQGRTLAYNLMLLKIHVMHQTFLVMTDFVVDTSGKSDDFRDYADLCLKSFGDRVKNWITLNEPWTNCHQCYAAGIFALGRCSPWEAGNCSAGDSG
ncbi:uncharacterized protein A4U43_C02F10180 [Asparagus officinalis]|uniref:Beta-glucosidase n=1 Tax=Asparagus officinalis TaxID=4686 RepID=A0A5P1FJ68_ASPOF|nr:uncharacterized protein A4U43_C02F10180 [Asparagus officinalis]